MRKLAREIEPPEEEKKFPDLATLSKLENWMHFTENILNVISNFLSALNKKKNKYLKQTNK